LVCLGTSFVSTSWYVAISSCGSRSGPS